MNGNHFLKCWPAPEVFCLRVVRTLIPDRAALLPRSGALFNSGASLWVCSMRAGKVGSQVRQASCTCNHQFLQTEARVLMVLKAQSLSHSKAQC